MSTLLILPILIPMVAGILGLATGGAPAVQRVIGIAGMAGLLASGIALLIEVLNGGVVAAQMGDWPAPFGITLVADRLSAAMVVIAGIIGLATALYAVCDIDQRRSQFGFQPLLQMLLVGVCGAFLTGDLFNLYVWFEVMLIASFGLLVLGGSREQLDGAVKYVAINLISTVLFLSGIGLLYGMTGTLNMADLHGAVREVENQGLVTTVAVMFIVAFGIKSAVFPLFFWLPASYHTPPVAVSAIFAGLLTKVGVYALIRVFTLIFSTDVGYTHTLLLWIAGATMITGVLGAAAQNDIRRILSFHIVSQIGYMVMGLALYTPLALAGAVFYVIHHIIVKANLFLVGGVANRLGGSFALDRIGGLYRASPLLAVLFLIPAFSLAGFPPLSGFWAKLVLIRAGLETQHYVIVAVALVVGLLTIYSMTKIWGQAFWKPAPADAEPLSIDFARPGTWWLILPVVGLALLTVVIGLMPEPFVAFATRAAEDLLDPTAYIDAVLGGAP